MRIAMLARNPQLYSHRRLMEAARARGHHVHALDTLLVYMNITPQHLEMRYRGELLPQFDAVIPRIGASITFYGLAVLRQFEMMGVYALNDSVGIGRSRDKLHSLQLLSRKGIHLPATGFAHATRYTEDIIAMVGGVPVVVKLLEGTQGIGVVLGETESAARSIIEAFRGVKVNILVQEFVKEAKGMDIRCLVVGDRVIGAIQRQGKAGDFRSNIHRGGKATPIEITAEERRTAIRAARVLGLNCAGVDMLRSNHGPVVVEVNSSPGLEAVERATGVDAAGKIVEFIEAHAPRHDEA